MQNLSSQHAQNYEAHPSFSFPQSSWEISVGNLEAFNNVYSVVQKMGDRLSRQSFAEIGRQCEQWMHAIFSEMRHQCADAYEQKFLDELQAQAKRLLKEELNWYAKRRPQRLAKLNQQEEWNNAIRLHEQRFYFGQLSKAAVDEMRDAADPEIKRFRSNASAGKLTRDELSVNTGPAVAKIRKILNREFEACGALDTLCAFTGRSVRVVGLALELSVPQATWWRNVLKDVAHPPETLYAHVDESVHSPKSIVYLSDVTPKNGPTGCYPGTYQALLLNPLQELIGRVVGYVGSPKNSPLHDYYGKQYHQSVGSERFRKHFMRLPRCLRFNSHMGWDVTPGTELEKSIAAAELKMTGPAGTFIVFDGSNLLHRGGMVEEGERIALQVIFSDLTLQQRILSRIKRISA